MSSTIRRGQDVPTHLCSWFTPWPGYAPADVTPYELDPAGGLAASVADGWAERTADPADIDWSTRTARLKPFTVGPDNRPRNPGGRTGRIGRVLGRWGENVAVDPVVVADGDVLLIRRGDCGDWAIPGGMVDPGETIGRALTRELCEETGLALHGCGYERMADVLVNDPRDTDWAWVATTVGLFRPAVKMTPRAGSDAAEARWWPFESAAQLVADVEAAGDRVYPPHRALLALADRPL